MEIREDTKKILEERNNRIIQAVLEKAKRLCPQSIAMIGICGSFNTGDIYEKSDLDLLIVINDDQGWQVGTTFILGDVAHDIYCTPWESLEKMAEFHDPYISKLMESKIVFCSKPEYMDHLMQLREKATNNLSSPFTMKDYEKANQHYEEALKCYAKVMLVTEEAKCRYAMAGTFYFVENTIAMANKEYYHKGVKRIPQELSRMKKLPKDFMKNYENALLSKTLDQIKDNTTTLMRSLQDFMTECKCECEEKRPIDKDALRGSYEEVFSNWRNKMYYAASEKNTYLSLMTAMSCQNFYDEMYSEYEIKHYDVMKDYSLSNLEESAKNFDFILDDYHKLYDTCGAKTKKYDTIEAFEKDYLS